MSMNISVIDGQATKLGNDHAEEFAERLKIKNDPVKLRSTAFVLLTVKHYLDLQIDDAFGCLTDGGNDFGVDALHIGSVEDGEFTVTLFQGKYTN